MTISQRITLAFWPEPSVNTSADIEAGNAEIDKLTLAELSQFFEECTTGPTFCLVRRHVDNRLSQMLGTDGLRVRAAEVRNEVRSFMVEAELLIQRYEEQIFSETF